MDRLRNCWAPDAGSGLSYAFGWSEQSLTLSTKLALLHHGYVSKTPMFYYGLKIGEPFPIFRTKHDKTISICQFMEKVPMFHGQSTMFHHLRWFKSCEIHLNPYFGPDSGAVFSHWSWFHQCFPMFSHVFPIFPHVFPWFHHWSW